MKENTLERSRCSPRHHVQPVAPTTRVGPPGPMLTLFTTGWFRSASSAAAFAPATPGVFAPRGQELIVDVHGARLKQDRHISTLTS